MFDRLIEQLKANPKSIVFTEGNDPRILEASSRLNTDSDRQCVRGTGCCQGKWL